MICLAAPFTKSNYGPRTRKRGVSTAMCLCRWALVGYVLPLGPQQSDCLENIPISATCPAGAESALTIGPLIHLTAARALSWLPRALQVWYDEYVPTTVGRAEPHNLALIHPTQSRVLTIRENARTQVRHRSLHV